MQIPHEYEFDVTRSRDIAVQDIITSPHCYRVVTVIKNIKLYLVLYQF